MSKRSHVVVTGGSSGIGRELVHLLIEGGYNVINISRREVTGNYPPDRLTNIQVDLADDSCIEAIRARMREIEGLRVVGFTHLAGVGQIASVERLEIQEISRTIWLNLTVGLCILKELLIYFDKQGSRIQFIGSRSRRFPFQGGLAYCSSKAALFAAADVLALDFRAIGWNIGVTIIEFGTVATGFAGVEITPQQIPVSEAGLALYNLIDSPQFSDTRLVEIVPSARYPAS